MTTFPMTLASTVLADLIAESITRLFPEKADPSELTAEIAMVALLARIAEQTDTREEVTRPLQLQPDPYEYFIPDTWHNRRHLCLFAPSSTTLLVRVPGMAAIIFTLKTGWNLLDVHGTLASGDASLSFNVLLSYRDDPIGTALGGS